MLSSVPSATIEATICESCLYFSAKIAFKTAGGNTEKSIIRFFCSVVYSKIFITKKAIINPERGVKTAPIKPTFQ